MARSPHSTAWTLSLRAPVPRACVLALALTGCAGKDAGPQQPISENLAPAVASPATEAFARPTVSSPYQTGPATTAPLEEEATELAKQEAPKQRETRHTFSPKVTRSTGATTVPVPGAPSGQGKAGDLTDGQIIRVAETIQNAELAEARVVEERTQNTRVKAFAQRLREDNKKLKSKQQALAKSEALVPSESSLSADLRVKASQELTSVELARPEEFDQAFIDAQIEQNQEHLQLLDGRLIPDTSDPKLKKELTKSRVVLERQLDEAKELRRSLKDEANPQR